AVVAAGVGDGGSGQASVDPGAYTLRETAASGTSLSNYASSISCTLNGGSGPSRKGTSLNVTVSAGDVLACTLTNKRKATIIVRKTLIPSSDTGRFDLKVGSIVVKAGAGDGDFGSTQVAP